MAEISAALVKELREETNVGMMECKKALVEAGGDKAKAVKILRERGLAIAGKKASRTAKEGLVASEVALGGKLVPSPVTAMSSCTPVGSCLLRRSICLRFSAMSARCASLISGSCSKPIVLRCSSTMLPSSATSDGIYTPPLLK